MHNELKTVNENKKQIREIGQGQAGRGQWTVKITPEKKAGIKEQCVGIEGQKRRS